MSNAQSDPLLPDSNLEPAQKLLREGKAQKENELAALCNKDTKDSLTKFATLITRPCE
jgi:hypothetical protein